MKMMKNNNNKKKRAVLKAILTVHEQHFLDGCIDKIRENANSKIHISYIDILSG